jgi:hypothetical protein
MQTPKPMLAALLALPLAIIACDGRPASREGAATTGGAQSGSEGRNEQAPQGPAQTGQGAEAVELGSQLGPDGGVTGNGTSFRAGEPVFAEIQAASLPPGANVRLAWVSPQGATLSTDEMVVPPDARVITLKAKDTSGWVPGAYRVDVAVGGASVGSRTFTISEGGAAD